MRLGRDRLPKAWVDRVVDQGLADGDRDSQGGGVGGWRRGGVGGVVDQALAGGDRDPQARAEAAPRRQVVAHPGAIWGPADVVVWWDFRDGGERPARSPWSAADRAVLEAQGCTPGEAGAAAPIT